jgi:hypothetical protein
VKKSAKKPNKRRGMLTLGGNPVQRAGSLAEKAETDLGIGDNTTFVPMIAHEMLVIADLVNRLRLAEEVLMDDYGLGRATSSRLEPRISEDVQHALLLPSEMVSRLPLQFIREQRATWEDELARYAIALFTPTLIARLDAHAQRFTAMRIRREGDAAKVKRTATYARIADELGLKGEHRERQVRRILSENLKSRGAIDDVDRRLLRRDLTPVDQLPDEVMVVEDETIAEIVRANGRKWRHE